MCIYLAAVIGTRAMLCMALMSGLIGWAVSMVALILHKPRFLLAVSLAFGIQGKILHIIILIICMISEYFCCK